MKEIDYKHITVILVFFISVEVSGQDFEFQIDRKGNAIYSDSVGILNQNLDTTFIKISRWGRGELQSPSDSLIFVQENATSVYLKKMLEIKGEADSVYFFTATILIELKGQILKYRVFDIYLVDPVQNNICGNLAATTDTCFFLGKNERWNRVRGLADRRIVLLLQTIEEAMSAK